MHEISLSYNILEMMEEQAKQQHFNRVKQIWLEIGDLSCIEEEALLFGLKTATENTFAEGMQIHIHHKEGEARCKRCGTLVKIHQFDQVCPHCNSWDLDIRSGKDVKIIELEVE